MSSQHHGRPINVLGAFLLIGLLAGCSDDDGSAATDDQQHPATRADAGSGAGPAGTQTLRLRADVEPVRSAADALPGVFIPPFVDCRQPLAGEKGEGPGGKVCTNVAISGCTEPGKYFPALPRTLALSG